MYRVTLLTADNMAGLLFANGLLRLGIRPDRVYLISEVRGGLLGGLRKAANLLFKKSVLFLLYKYFVEGLLFRCWLRKRAGLLDFDEIGRDFSLPVTRVRDVAAPGFKRGLAELEPGQRLFLSAYGSQVFDAETVSSCGNFWNVHGSWLPFLRGAAPYFWMLIGGASPKGVTIHRVAEKLDSGEILSRREVAPEAGDSLFTYHARCVAQAARAAAELIMAGSEPRGLPADPGAQPSFGGLPSRADMRAFLASGRRLFRLRDADSLRELSSELAAGRQQVRVGLT